MPPANGPASFDPKSAAAEGRKTKTGPSTPAEPPPGPDLVTLTVDAATGRLVGVEAVDPSGARHALSEDDRARIAARGAEATLEHIVEQAFEAGIDCVLGEGSGEQDIPESVADAELSRVLLRSLIEDSAAGRLVQRDILDLAIVGTLIAQAVAFDAATPESGAAH